MLIPLDIPPGLYRNGTQYESQGRYYEADLWRWFENTMRPIGGWRQRATDTVSGAARCVLTWLDNSNNSWIGIGTNEGLYVSTRSGTVYDITPSGFTDGPEDAVAGGGYGISTYGTGIYGIPRPDSTNIIPAAVWSLDTWGENLVGCFGGTIYEWSLDTGVDAAAVTGAPSAESMIVTEERIMMALGADGDPRALDWSDAEDNTDWTPSSTNLAGGRRLQTVGRILTARRVKGGGLVFTDVDVHRWGYVGLPQVYAFERLASGCGAISKGSVIATDVRTFWMGVNGFWIYDGDVSPLPCDLSDDLFSNLNRQQASKVSALHNSSFGEIWWFYPSSASTECDRYVIYNYREGHWSAGVLTRLSGVDRGVFVYPIMIGSDGKIYEHEVGQNRDGRSPYAMSGPVEISDGDRTMEIHSIIPDEQTLGEVEVSFQTGDYAMSGSTSVGPYVLSDKTDVRFSARRVAVKYEAVPDADFRVGRFRFEAKQGSPR